jgi:hypothetical protein
MKQGTDYRTEKRVQCLELALSVLANSENIVYDKSMESDQNIEETSKNNLPIVLDCKGRGIQNAVFTYKSINPEKVVEVAEKFFDFINKQ